MAKTDIGSYPKGVSGSPVKLDLTKPSSCSPLGIQDSRPDNKDRVQSAK